MNPNEITFPYNFAITFTDGEQSSVDIPLSLSMATRFAEDMVRENLDVIEAIEIVDNYTGELVYSVKANIRIDISFETYNPYNV
jgi:hypothetical protein